MEILTRFLPLLVFLALPAEGGELPYRVIAYHDVRDQVAADYDPDQYAVSTANLIDQFTWLRDNGFHAVSVDQIIAAREGLEPLPEKSVLLTFDDGLASVYSHVFPLLKMFDYPAVVSVVTSWIDSDRLVDYADRKRGRDGFLNWEQMREIAASGLVEFASHTHDLHQGIRANPQGNLQPAAKTRAFDGSKYESEADFRRRIGADLARSVTTMQDELGHKPRVIVWPYGAFNRVSEFVAHEQGMRVVLTLDQTSTTDDKLVRLGRYLMTANPYIGDFSSEFLIEKKPYPILRVAQIDLDDVYDHDSVQQSRNLDRLLDRIKALEISHVFLQAFADQDGDGSAKAVYFPNRHLPMQADLVSYVAWQLKTRANVSVFAWLPVLSFTGDAFDPAWRVVDNRDAADTDAQPLLSPFHELARERIAEVYEDLAAHSHLDGVLFHDDGRLSEFEDFSEAAVARFKAEFDRDITPDRLAGDADLNRRWTELRSEVLVQFSAELLARVRQYHSVAKSTRSLSVDGLAGGAGADRLGGDFDAFLDAYDFVALMTAPSLQGATDSRRLLEDIVAGVRRREDGLARTIFELQTVDRTQSELLPDEELRSTMRWLQSMGVRNLGYYPGDFIDGGTDFDQVRLGMSLAEDFAGALR